jgi:AGCS family alanine or glycine:cation symporter
MFYIAQGLKVPALGTLVAILLFIQNAGGTLIQSNVIAKVVHANFRLPTFVTGVIVATLMIIIIHGGFKRLVHVEQKLVPLMACLYIGGGLVVVLFNLSSLPEVFSRIFHEALTFRAGLGGAGAIAMRYGVARGLYSNEAGEGSAAVIHSTAEVKHPVEQGLMGLAEVFVDTMIICSNTGLAVLASGIPLKGADASTLAAQAFSSVFAPMQYIVYVSLLLFAFTSLMSQWLFGQVSLQYLKCTRGDQIYKIIFPIAVLLGSVSTIKAVWSLQNCALGLLIIPNIMAMIVLVPKVSRLNRAYFREGKNEKR